MSYFNFYTILLLTCIFSKANSSMAKEKVVIAVNCGGDDLEDSNGVNFVKVNNLIKYYRILDIIMQEHLVTMDFNMILN